MCFDHDSRPPIAPIAGGAAAGERVVLRSTDGAELAAFFAATERPTGAAMLILPDVRGLHPYYAELALRFAEAGVAALAIDYFGRTAGVTGRDAEFEYMPHVGQARYSTLIADAAAGAAELRRRGTAARAMFSIGFCFGGRLSFLLAAREQLALSGVVGFYGVPIGAGRAEMPAPADLAGQMSVPVLGLFGGDDPGIPAESVAAFERALVDAGVKHELVSYPGAPHSFFDRKAEQHADDSADAWRRVLDFVRRNTL